MQKSSSLKKANEEMKKVKKAYTLTSIKILSF